MNEKTGTPLVAMPLGVPEKKIKELLSITRFIQTFIMKLIMILEMFSFVIQIHILGKKENNKFIEFSFYFQSKFLFLKQF